MFPNASRSRTVQWSGATVCALTDARDGRIDSACLREFIRLADCRPEKIARFAERYGPLFLGPHGLPVNDADLPSRIDQSEPPLVGPTIGSTGEQLITYRVWYREPIEGWRAWARYVGTVLVLCHELCGGERIVPDERTLRRPKRIGYDPGSQTRS